MQPTADGKGKRYDDGKTRFELIPFDALRVIAEVFTQGAAKYEPRNWERGMLFSRCLGSLMRHITAWQNGEDVDAESGLPHMAHAAWNCIALLTYGLRGTGEDDRPARPEPESRLETIQRLLKEEFDVPAFELAGIERSDLKIWCNKAGLTAEADVAAANQTAASSTARDLEKCCPTIYPKSPLVIGVKQGDRVFLNSRVGIYRVVALLDANKVSVAKSYFNPNEHGPVEVIPTAEIHKIVA